MEDQTKQVPALAEEEDLEAQLAYQNLKKRREARKRKRIIIISIVAAIAIGGLVFHFVSQAQQEAEANKTVDPLTLTSPVTRGTYSSSVNANGATEPLSSTVVTPEVEGIIENLQVEVGQQVNKGDMLFAIKNDKLDSGVREAQDGLESAERALERANTAIDKADRGVDEAYDARQSAWEKANSSGNWEEYDETTLSQAITAAEDALDSAYADRDEAASNVDKAQVALDEAKAEADKRTITAPVSGTIISMSAKEGASTSGSGGGEGGGEPLLQIVDLSQMKVTVQVNEVDISAIKEGQDATATFSALADVVMDAKVTRIASTTAASSEGTGGGGGGVVTYAVDLLIPKPDPKLKPGMTASVTIVTESVPNTLLVPAASVGEDEEGTYVVVVDDVEAKQVHRVDVEVAAKNNTDAAISGDLAEGDAVLLDPTSVDLGGENGDGDAPLDETKPDLDEDESNASSFEADEDDESGNYEIEKKV